MAKNLNFDGCEAMVAMIGDWKISYLSFSRPDNAFKNPLVILLGGAFPNISSLHYEIEQFSKEFPLYLVELPEDSSLNFQDYAKLVKSWMDQLGIEKITPLALGHNSLIGYYLASLYPRRVHKLIVEGMAMHSHLKKILEIEESEDRKYLGKPSQDTLMLMGEFDRHLALAEQSFQREKEWKQGHFTVIKGIGHVAAPEKRDVLVRLCRRFLNGRPLNRMKDVKLY